MDIENTNTNTNRKERTMNTNRNNAENTTQRDWHDLKPGDMIWFANGWFEIFDAYAVGYDTIKIKLHIPACRGRGFTAPEHIETYNVRTTGSKATCRA